MAGMIRRHEELELEPLIVSEGHRESGIGGSLANAVIEAARKQDGKMLSVSPVARNDSAIRFFHDLGFDTLGHLQMFMDFSPANRQKWRCKKRMAGRDFRY